MTAKNSENSNALRYDKNLVSFTKKMFAKDRNKRALSDVIATLLLVAITVVFAVMLATFFQGSFGTVGAGFNPAALESRVPPTLKITGYDTRDGAALYGISFLGNSVSTPTGSKLCTVSCAPANTEFIVIKVKNDGASSYVINDILINDKDHLWDTTSSVGTYFSSGSYPNAGYFRIISKTDLEQKSNTLASGDEVRIVIRLSKDLTIGGSDIAYYTPLRIYFTGNPNAPTFVIFSGDVT